MQQLLNKIVYILCILFIITPSYSTKAVALLTFSSYPSDFQFPQVTLNGTNQSVSGGGGKLVVSQLLSAIDQWSITVQASQFKETGGTGIVLPANSLQLNPPDGGTYNYLVQGGPWIIDSDSPVVMVSGYTLLGILPVYTFDFGQNAFTLKLDPGRKIIDSGQTSAVYTSTITWTLNSPIL